MAEIQRSGDPLTDFYRACNPHEPIGPDDPRYVDCSEARGGDAVKEIERALRRSDPLVSDVRLFTGHRGVGKTSELRRLRRNLETATANKPKSTFRVISFDVSVLLDVNDLDLPDLIVCTASQVQKQMRDWKISGFDHKTAWLTRVWDDIRNNLGATVALQEVEVDAGFLSLTTEIRNRPNARRELREAIDRHGSRLLDAVNDLLQLANAKIIDQGFQGLVLIIDGLDKLVRRELDGGKSNTHKRLFLDRSEQLASLKSHTIYTVPISMIYEPQTAQLEQTMGEFQHPVPMINLRGEGRSKVDPETVGMRKMWEIIAKRAEYSEADMEDLFDDPSTAYFLCEMTGGHPRHLIMFLRAAMDGIDALPITRAAAEAAVRRHANSLLRQIPDSFWDGLRNFATPQDDMPSDVEHQQMLFNLHVFEYLNGRPWYEVNPVIRTLDRFRSPQI